MLVSGQITLVFIVQSCLTFCDPMHCSMPGSSVHGILQAKILKTIISYMEKEHFYTDLQISFLKPLVFPTLTSTVSSPFI